MLVQKMRHNGRIDDHVIFKLATLHGFYVKRSEVKVKVKITQDTVKEVTLLLVPPCRTRCRRPCETHR